MDEPNISDISANGKEHYEEYLLILHEKTWADLSKMDNIFGSFIWCMYDFASDTREEGDTMGQNDKGLVTRKRIEKDAFYFYQSVWQDKPMVHITSKRYTQRPIKIPVIKAYSNADFAELFVNNISCGTVKKYELNKFHSTIFKWENIEIANGKENIIKVVAYFSNGEVLNDFAVWSGIAQEKGK